MKEVVIVTLNNMKKSSKLVPVQVLELSENVQFKVLKGLGI